MRITTADIRALQARGIKKTKKEFLKRIIYPLIGTLLTIYYIVATLEAMK